MAETFTKKTFEYFEQAKRNKKNRKWFEKNRERFEEHVREPFRHLLELIELRVGRDLPRILINNRKITSPLVRANKVSPDSGIVRSQTHIHLQERQTSQFEWNPGIYISVGASPDDNVYGLGLYMVSGRQMKRMRNYFVSDFAAANRILASKKLKKHWGGFAGDKYKRFPKGFDETSRAAKYLWHKHFFLMNEPSRRAVTSRGFFDDVVNDLKIAMPFMKWLRSVVGVYKTPSKTDWLREA